MTRLFLIDGTALAYRSYFAFASGTRGGLSTKAGQPTGAVYGFLMTLRALMEREQPDLVVVSFDGAREGLARTKVYAAYKSTRSKMPEDLVPQLAWIGPVSQRASAGEIAARCLAPRRYFVARGRRTLPA